MCSAGYDASVGRVTDCTFLNNTLYQNDLLKSGNGEVWIQFASGNAVRDNLIFSNSQDLLIDSVQGTSNNVSDYNLFYGKQGPATGNFSWDGQTFNTYADYLSATGQDVHSLFADPRLTNPRKGNFAPAVGSPAINTGDPAFDPAPGETDIVGRVRLVNVRVDIGAYEVG